MRRTGRVFVVACLTAAFVTIPWNGAFAGERDLAPSAQQAQSLGEGKIWRSALALAPGESRMMRRQTVATSTESKLLVALIAGSALVAGATMVAYGSTASCKGRFGSGTASCDRMATIGAVTFGAGAAMLVLWTLSR